MFGIRSSKYHQFVEKMIVKIFPLISRKMFAQLLFFSLLHYPALPTPPSFTRILLSYLVRRFLPALALSVGAHTQLNDEVKMPNL